MSRYQLRYVTYAAEQLRHMPRQLRPAYEARVENLKRDPYAAGDYHEKTGSYSTTFSSGGEDSGIILYVMSDQNMTVTIIRINWVKW